MSIFCQNSTVFCMQGIMWIVLDRYTWIIINYKMLMIVYDFILFSVGLFFYRTFVYKREFLWVKPILTWRTKLFFSLPEAENFGIYILYHVQFSSYMCCFCRSWLMYMRTQTYLLLMVKHHIFIEFGVF